MKWKKNANIEDPKNLEEIIIEKYNRIANKPWTLKQPLSSEQAEKVLYDLIHKELKGKGVICTFKDIYEHVDKILPKVIKQKEPKEKIEQEVLEKENTQTDPSVDVTKESEMGEKMEKKAAKRSPEAESKAIKRIENAVTLLNRAAGEVGKAMLSVYIPEWNDYAKQIREIADSVSQEVEKRDLRGTGWVTPPTEEII